MTQKQPSDRPIIFNECLCLPTSYCLIFRFHICVLNIILICISNYTDVCLKFKHITECYNFRGQKLPIELQQLVVYLCITDVGVRVLMVFYWYFFSYHYLFYPGINLVKSEFFKYYKLALLYLGQQRVYLDLFCRLTYSEWSSI